MSLLSSMYGDKTPPGWSARGGQVRSAYGPEMAVGGSSTGNAVALAAGFCAGSIACETDGSIVGLLVMSEVDKLMIADSDVRFILQDMRASMA
jgi:hypothetical protein